MDAGTVVALVLDPLGFGWGALTFFVNRHDANGRAAQDGAVAGLASVSIPTGVHRGAKTR